MSLKKNILKLLEQQDKETPVSVDLISQRLGHSRKSIEEELRELIKEGKVDSLQGQEVMLYFKKRN